MANIRRRNRLITIAAVLYWILVIINASELFIEGTSFINIFTTVVFFLLAVYFTFLMMNIRRMR